MKIEAAIFDLDGTLVHTKPAYRYLVVGNTLKTFGITTLNKIIDDFWFEGEKDRKKIITDLWHLDPQSQFWPAYRVYDTSDLREQHTEAYNDVGILFLLKERGIKTGIVTSAPSHIITLELSLLNHRFDAVVRAQDGVKQKPDSDGLMQCMDNLGVSPDRTYYVGNNKEDMEMARNARVCGIRIDREEYNYGKIEADLTIDSLEELRVLV
ncbi:hypothetical protein A3K73_03455 [Candidatus Pacearchaeota archaeon RBG_13_36_9]|nr:MAG: hypothetical protein A3K73_03455 [Candidatus Pacearchaeota archaeon RBG_13_36_9]